MSERVVVVVQARTGSTRLPGKVLLPLAGSTLLERMLERVAAAREPAEVVVATTVDASDDPVREVARRAGVRAVSGHPTDLLDRHVAAARICRADVVVKVPSDCPLVDPAILDRVIEQHRLAHVDFTSNLHPATYPDGNDVEVMPLAVLELAHREATQPHEREHTTPFVWDHPERFRLHNVTWERGLDLSMSHRFTIDYPEDYDFIRAVYDALYVPGRPPFTLDDILTLLDERPELHRINARYAGVNWYRHHLSELRTVTARETRRYAGESPTV